MHLVSFCLSLSLKGTKKHCISTIHPLGREKIVEYLINTATNAQRVIFIDNKIIKPKKAEAEKLCPAALQRRRTTFNRVGTN